MTQEERKSLAIQDCARDIHKITNLLSSIRGAAFEKSNLEAVLDKRLAVMRSLRFDENTPHDVGDNGGFRIICSATRDRLRKEFPHWVGPLRAPTWEAIYWHYDNVFHMCSNDKVPVPQWFQQYIGALHR